MARFRFSFWLDCDKDEELLLAEQIDELKHERSFTRTIRQGIRLICDLRAGRFDVLFELFPELRKCLKEEDQGSPEEIKAMRKQIARMERLLIQKVPNGYTLSERSLEGRTRTLPRIEVDEFDTELIEIKPDTSNNSGRNFLNSLTALQS